MKVSLDEIRTALLSESYSRFESERILIVENAELERDPRKRQFTITETTTAKSSTVKNRWTVTIEEEA